MRAYDVRTKRDIAKFQWGLFRRELTRVERNTAKWKANQPNRAKNAGLHYMTYEELYEDYIIGNIDEKEFYWQRKLYNTIIADNTHRYAKMEWLRKNCEHYRREYEALDRYYTEVKRKEKRKENQRYRNKINGKKKMYYDPHKRRSIYNQPKIERNKEKFGKRRNKDE